MSPPLDPGSVLRTCLSGKLHQFVAVLADEPLLVVTGDVVPHRPVPVEVVKHCDLERRDIITAVMSPSAEYVHRPRHARPPP